jgi:hypothetical protein
MDQSELEGVVKDINARTTRIEQKLPELATKSDVREQVKQEGERTRRHFDVVADGVKEGIKVIADGHKALDDRITNLGRDIKSVLVQTTVIRPAASARRREPVHPPHGCHRHASKDR